MLGGLQLIKFIFLQGILGMHTRLKSKESAVLLFGTLSLIVGTALFNLTDGFWERYIKLCLYVNFVFMLTNYQALNYRAMKKLSIWLVSGHLVMQVVQLLFPKAIYLYGAQNLIFLKREIGLGVNHHDGGLLLPILLFPFLFTARTVHLTVAFLLSMISAVLSGSKTSLLFIVVISAIISVIRLGLIKSLFMAALFCVLGYVYVSMLDCFASKDFCNGIWSLFEFIKFQQTSYNSVTHRLEDWQHLIRLLLDAPVEFLLLGYGENKFTIGVGGSMIEVGIVSYIVNYGVLLTSILLIAMCMQFWNGRAGILIIAVVFFEFLVNITQNTIVFTAFIWTLEILRRERRYQLFELKKRDYYD